MKKFLLIAMLACIATATAQQADNTDYTLYIELQDGQSHNYRLDDIRRMYFLPTEESGEDNLLLSNADNLEPTELSEDELYNRVDKLGQYLGAFHNAQYILLGSKNYNKTSPHQYEYTNTLTINCYAGYTTNTQRWYGRFPSTYSDLYEFCEGPYNKFVMLSNCISPFLNDDVANDFVELKAIALLLLDHAAQEMTDIYGTIPYLDYKNNKSGHPYTFNSGADIYNTIFKNIDDIIAVFDNFESHNEQYKTLLRSILEDVDQITQTKSLKTWKRYANSLKLRMAMHLAQVDPYRAQTLAEEAVSSGVIESKEDELGLNPKTGCEDRHPLETIMNSWNDSRVNASFVSLLTSLSHPYSRYLLAPISDDLRNSKTGKTTAKGSTVAGLRAGVKVGDGQTNENHYTRYSTFANCEDFQHMNIYAMKWAEVDFLRAEGALRGWDMGGMAETFYYRGIRNGDCSDRFGYPTGNYDRYIEDYLAVENPTPYKYVDPMDDDNNIDGVTTIGVRWNETDSRETKLEKIITQKYIAVFPHGYEAWTDIRRTGYPKIFPVLNPEDGDGSLKYGDIIRRNKLPGRNTEAGRNDISTSGLKALGGEDLMSTRVFWDVDTPNF